jgi:O-antigen/teichoic acid export membrane protein
MMRLIRRSGKAPITRSYSAGLVFSLGSFVVIGIVVLLTSVLSARLYGITIIGQYALVLAPISIITLLSTVREQPAMVREIAKLEPMHPRVTGVVLAVFTFSFTLTLTVTIIGLVACHFIFYGPLHHPKLFAPAAVGLGGYLVLINTCWNIDGTFGAFRAAKELFAVRLHQALVYCVLVVGLSFVAHSLWCLVLAFLGSWLTAFAHRLLLIRRVVRWRVPKAEIRAGFATLREIIGFGLRITPGFIATGLSEESGTWILGFTNPIIVVGAYSRASNIASRFGELNWRVTEMLLPTLVQRRASGDTDGYNRVITDSLRYVAFGMLVLAAVGGGASRGIMRIFGTGFEPAAHALLWLLFLPVLQTLTAIQGSVLMAENRPLWTTVGQVARLIITIGGGVALTLSFGVTGMAIAISGGCLANLIIYFLAIWMSSSISLPRASWLARQTGALVAAYAGGFWVARAVERHVSGTLGLLLALVTGLLAYIVIAVSLGGLTEDDRGRLHRLNGQMRVLKPFQVSG